MIGRGGEIRHVLRSALLPLAPRSGEEMQKVIADLFDISPDALAKVRDVSKP